MMIGDDKVPRFTSESQWPRKNPTGRMVCGPTDFQKLAAVWGSRWIMNKFTPWQIKMEHNNMKVWKMSFLFKGVIFRFHVNFLGCAQNQASISQSVCPILHHCDIPYELCYVLIFAWGWDFEELWGYPPTKEIWNTLMTCLTIITSGQS